MIKLLSLLLIVSATVFLNGILSDVYLSKYVVVQQVGIAAIVGVVFFVAGFFMVKSK
jgi:hypothetical protein